MVYKPKSIYQWIANIYNQIITKWRRLNTSERDFSHVGKQKLLGLMAL